MENSALARRRITIGSSRLRAAVTPFALVGQFFAVLCKGRAGDTPGCPSRPGPAPVLTAYPNVIRTKIFNASLRYELWLRAGAQRADDVAPSPAWIRSEVGIHLKPRVNRSGTLEGGDVARRRINPGNEKSEALLPLRRWSWSYRPIFEPVQATDLSLKNSFGDIIFKAECGAKVL